MNFSFNGGPDQGLDWLQFASSIVSSLAWPLTILVIVLLFRGKIAELLEKLEEASWGDGSVKFRLNKAERKVEAAVGAAAIKLGRQIPMAFGNGPKDQVDERFQQLLEIEPSAAIMHKWNEIENTLRELALKHGVSSADRIKSANFVAQQLNQLKVLPKEVLSWLFDMRQIRNAAAHGKEVQVTDAFRFKEQADRVMQVLSAL